MKARRPEIFSNCVMIPDRTGTTIVAEGQISIRIPKPVFEILNSIGPAISNLDRLTNRSPILIAFACHERNAASYALVVKDRRVVDRIGRLDEFRRRDFALRDQREILFRRCLAALVNELGPKGPLICFPNRLSIGEIQRQGFRCVTELRAYARQTLVVRASNSTLVQDSPPAIQTKASNKRTGCVCKDANYLNWRYVRNPARRYQYISGCNAPEDFAVVRELALPLGQRASVVMDMSAEEDADRSGVLRQVHQWARRRGLICNFLFCSGSPLRALGKGYIPLPSWLQPKRHLVFMKFPASMDQEEMTTWRYAFQIGDWDGL